MTESVDTPTEEAEVSPAPAVETPAEPAKKEPTKKDTGLPVGQIAVGGVGATVLGSAALASVVGPLGWLAAPAAAGAAGVGYVAYRRRRKRGRRGSQRRAEQSKTTTTRTRTVGGGSRLGGSGLSGARGRAATTAARSDGVGSAARPAGRGAAGGSARGGARPGGAARGGSSPRGGGLRGGASPRGGSPRTAPRGGTTPRGGGLFGRGGSDATTSKRTSRPTASRPTGGGTTRGGSAAKNRWGGASGPTAASGGRIKRAARAARDWADDRTGRKASTAFKAARKEKGFRARSKAARTAVRSKGSGRVTSGVVGALAAVMAGIASLFSKPGNKPGKSTPEDDDPTSANPYHSVYTWLADGTPFVGLIPKELLESTDPLRFKNPNPWPTTTSSTHTGGTTMAGSRSLPHAQHAADMLASVTRYEPEDLFVVIDQARQWPDMVRDLAMAVRTYVQVLQANRFPLQNGSIDALQDLYEALIKTMPAAEAIHPQMCRDHAVDLDRANYGRGDERKANVH